jgi:hypothetical protein
MIPSFLIPEMTVRENGFGPAVPVSEASGRTLQLTLGINRIVEQESLDLSIWGSADNVEWTKSPIATFPQKFYCGTYTILLDLATRPEIRWIRAEWRLHRWGRGSLKPLFGFFLFVEELKAVPLAAAVS